MSEQVQAVESANIEKITDARRRNLRAPWQPGQSGNPAGRPHRPSVLAALRRAATREQLDAVARRLVLLAKRGNVRAIEVLFRYLQSEPQAAVLNIGLSVGSVSLLDRVSTEEVDRILRERFLDQQELRLLAHRGAEPRFPAGQDSGALPANPIDRETCEPARDAGDHGAQPA